VSGLYFNTHISYNVYGKYNTGVLKQCASTYIFPTLQKPTYTFQLKSTLVTGNTVKYDFCLFTKLVLQGQIID